MPQTWNDDRLTEGFDQLRAEVHGFRAEANRRFESVDLRFEAVDSRLESMQRTMLYAAVTLSASMLSGFVALFTLIATRA